MNYQRDWDEFGDSSQKLENVENMTEVALAGATYYINLPASYSGALQLLNSKISTPEMAYQMSQFLQFIRKTRFVRAADSDGEVNSVTARRMFMAALQQKEHELASALKAEVAATNAADYIE